MSWFFFAAGEKVLCFHGPLLYEAKCLRAEVKDHQNKYYIHYSGWNKKYFFERIIPDKGITTFMFFSSWDEWVPEGRVLKFNDQAIQKQKELLKAHEAST